MKDTDNDNHRYRLAFVILLTIFVTVAFAALVRGFLLAVLIAVVFSALLHPFYNRVRHRLHLTAPLASGAVLFFLVIAVGVPLLAIAGLVAGEALSISEAVAPWVRSHLAGEGAFAFALPDWIPFRQELEPYQAQIVARLSELAGGIGQFLFNSIGEATRGTVGLFLNLFVFLYAMFFFLIRGPELVESALAYLPLADADRERLIERGLTVTRATLRSILIIGLIQGVMVGGAFWIVGIDGAAFWGTIVLILSAIPALGSIIVWGPAVVYLFAVDEMGAALGLAVWGTLVIGLVDNILRPTIIGSEAKVPDLLILLSILGGIGAFGVVGIVVGPIIAAVFLTVLDIYRATFRGLLSRDEDGGGS